MAIKKRNTVPNPEDPVAPTKLVIVAGEKKTIPVDSRIADMYGPEPTPAQMRRVGPVALSTSLSPPDENLTVADRLALLRTPYDKNNPQEARYRNRVRNRGTAITAMCIVCTGGRKAVTECAATQCPLWPFRMGGDPFYKKRG